MNNKSFKRGGAYSLCCRCTPRARTGRLGHRPARSLSVSNAAFGKDLCDRALAYCKSVNARGGVGLKNIELVTPNDADNHKTAGVNTRNQLSYCRPCL